MWRKQSCLCAATLFILSAGGLKCLFRRRKVKFSLFCCGQFGSAVRKGLFFTESLGTTVSLHQATVSVGVWCLCYYAYYESMPWLCVVCVCVGVLGNTKLPLLPAVLLNCLDSLGVCWLLLLALVLLLSTYVLYLHWFNVFISFRS